MKNWLDIPVMATLRASLMCAALCANLFSQCGLPGVFQRMAAPVLMLWFFLAVPLLLPACTAAFDVVSKRIFVDNAIGKTLRRKPQCLLQKKPLEARSWISFAPRGNVFMASNVGDRVVLRDGRA